MLVGVLLAGVKLPAAAPGGAAHTTRPPRHSHARAQPAHAALPSFNRQAALAAIRAAIARSNAVWQAALTNPSTAGLGAVKTGPDLAANTTPTWRICWPASEHWRIALRSFNVLSGG